ncbi:MAG TPA: lysophospholipid acyltransferase family protein [Polyangia bacterium]|nr:lysophospholipid acyltransferase family protein [Polyangia bacterium]
MIAGPLATVYAVYKTLAISVPTVVEALTGRLTIERCDERLRDWSHAIIKQAGVELTVSGLDHVPRDRACIFMSNHQSHFDIPIIYVAFPGTLRMVAKAELFRVPIWGRAMREAGFVSVDRSGDRQQAMEAMREAGEALGRGINIWIAPEGTRSPDGKLGKLKKGGFIMAQATGAPIVPMSIDGSRDILPKNTKLVRPGAVVRVTFGEPLAVPDAAAIERAMADVRAFFVAHVTEPEPDGG